MMKYSRRLPPWGHSGSQPSASIGKYAPSNTILFSPTDPPFESRDVSDALRDVIAVGFAFLFVSTIGIGFAFALFLMLFVDLR